MYRNAINNRITEYIFSSLRDSTSYLTTASILTHPGPRTRNPESNRCRTQEMF